MTQKDYLNPKILAPLIIISLLSGMIGTTIALKLQNNQNNGYFNQNLPPRAIEDRHYVEESDGINAIQSVAPSVISIVATKDLQIFRSQPFDPFFFFDQDPFFKDFGFPFPFQQRQQQQQPQQQEPETQRQKVSGGTGFIIQADGLALTNKHVVSDTKADYTAVMKDDKEYDVEIISLDPSNDLAVIQLHEKTEDPKDRKTGEKKNFGAKPTDLPVARLGDSSALKVGQRVFAIGNARGEYNNSVTSGIISAQNREIQAGSAGGGQQETLSGLLQTDAAINFGNSGGPLINLAGEVIGVNTAIDAAASGIGFAIPVNQIKPAIESVRRVGRIVRPILGVMHILLTKEKAKELKLDSLEYGALIVGDRSKREFGVIPGSPAEKAGLRMDDVILEVDGEKVTVDNALQNIVQRHAPGDRLALKVWRAGAILNITVTLEEKKTEEQ